MNSTNPHQRLERLPAVMARTGMSRSWIYKEVARGCFPRPVKVGGATAWNSTEVEAWVSAVLGGKR